MFASQEAKGLALALNITARPAPAADSPETSNAVYIGDHQVWAVRVCLPFRSRMRFSSPANHLD